MFISRLSSSVLVVFLSFNLALAQTSADDKSKDVEKQQIALLEQIAKDAESLRLAENRALVSAKLAEGFWQHDDKRARALFQASINELIAAQAEAEVNKKQISLLYGLINGVSPRQDILNVIATRDPELALESFYKSRPAKIAQIITDPVESKKTNNQQYVYNEVYFEQVLIARVSEQNPQRALKLIRESLAKGVTYEAIGLINRIKIKDAALAAEIAGEVADKLLATDYDKPNQDFSLATSFLTEFGKKPEEGETPVKVDQKKLRDLASLVARNILKSEEEYYDIESLLPLMEKFAPENVAPLKRKLAKLENSAERREYAAYEKFMETDPSTDKLLAEADKFPESVRNQMYYTAAEKIAQSGNLNQAQKIISTKMSSEETESYLTQINYGLITKAIADGKFEEANALINETSSEASRFALLMQLATGIYQKNPAENKKQTLAVLEQARAQIPQPQETIEEMSNLMQLAITLAEIEPEQAFQTVESLTLSMNEYIEAANIVAKYRNEGTLRQGEMLMNSYGVVSSFYNLSPVLTALKNKDFKRAMNFINGFQRAEVRLQLLIQMIEITPTDSPINVPAG